MTLTLFTILLLLALGLTVVHAAGKSPVWPAVLIVIVALLTRGVAVGGERAALRSRINADASSRCRRIELSLS